MFDDRGQYIKIQVDGIRIFSPDQDINITTTKDHNVEADKFNVLASQTNLGSGGAPIARQGDAIQVTITRGSSSGTYNGTITGGGNNTSI